MLVDYHNHTTLCHHAVGTMEEYLDRAVEIGVNEYGFSEHSPWMIQLPHEPLAMSYEEMPGYVRRVLELREQYAGRLTLRLGIEVDFVPSRMDIARQHLAAHPFDYHIGSIHHLDSWGIDNPAEVNGFKQRSLRMIYDEYFSMMRDMVRTGLIDIVGHLDLPKKFGHRFEGQPGWDDMIEETLDIIQQTGVTVEINLAGWDKPINEPYPSFGIMKRLHRRGIPITLGSDAHSPEAVGKHLRRIVPMLRDIGFTHIMSFCRREAKPLLL